MKQQSAESAVLLHEETGSMQLWQIEMKQQQQSMLTRQANPLQLEKAVQHAYTAVNPPVRHIIDRTRTSANVLLEVFDHGGLFKIMCGTSASAL